MARLKTFLDSRRTIVAASALLLMGSTAMAADEIVAAPSYQSWTGFYGGIAVGAGGGVQKLDADLGFISASLDGIGSEGYLGSIYAGYDYQLNSNIVIGLMADYTFSAIDTTLDANIPLLPATLDYDLSGDQSWSILARAGYLTGPNTLVYGLAGYTNQKYSGSLDLTGGFPFASNYSFDSGGWTAGAGIENRIGNNLALKLEYRFTQLNDVSIFPPFLSASPSQQTVQLGLSYKFGGGGGAAPVRDAVAMNWTGFVIGAEAGGINSVTQFDINAAPAATAGFNGLGGEGGAIGIKVGYDHQFGSNFVGGVRLGLRKTNASTDLSIGPLNILSLEENYEVSAIAKLGWLSGPDTQWYGLVGRSWGEAELSAILGLTLQQQRQGWIFGGGVETAVTENVSTYLEYRNTQYDGNDFAGGLLTTTPSTHSAMFGLSYRFGGN